jgi:hypothetical protein
MDLKNNLTTMDKIKVEQTKDGKYFITIYSETGNGLKTSNGFELNSNDAYNLYIQLREFFTKNN